MTGDHAPLTPADCDLRDFAFMPLDFARLFASAFHARATDSEWRAGVTLWCRSYHQVPCGSLPNDEIELVRLAELGRDYKTWRKISKMALHGWILCDDGRLYHPTVCEKALEGWLEKLVQRKSSGAGNAKRYGHIYDPSQIEAKVSHAEKLLKDLNPNSKWFAKRIRKGGVETPETIPVGDKKSPADTPESIPAGSQETLKRHLREEKKEEPPIIPPSLPGLPTDARPDGRAKKPKRIAHRIPDAWNPSLEDRRFALDLGLDPDAVAANFRDYWIGTGKPMADWSATWRNWCRRQNPDGSAGRGSPPVVGPGGGGPSLKPTTGWGEQARQKAELFGEN